MLRACFRFVVCVLFVVHSQTDVSSFGIVTSTDSPAVQSVHLSLTLSWNTEQWECSINTTIAPNTYYGCMSTDVQPEATLITTTLPSNTYSMKMDLIDIDTGIEDSIRIETVRVLDDDSNYYEIDEFCLPKPFSKAASGGVSLELLECCYWRDRYKHDTFALGAIQNATLKIAYIMFSDNVLSYKNSAQEGAIKPPIITQVGISTLPTQGLASSATFSLTLHWDSDVYEWSDLRPSSTNSSFTTTLNQSEGFCDLTPFFSLEFSSTTSTSDSVGIDRITLTDEAHFSYDIEYFCNSDQIRNDRKYGDLGRVCDGAWSSYQMYDGFIYNGSKSIYFIWSDDVFVNANASQQAFALDDHILSSYDCSADPSSITSKNIVIFKDDLDDPTATGWVFSGSYMESLSAVNCPGGSLDSCSRIGGTGTMVVQVNITQYRGTRIAIQYDMRLSSMPSGARCTLYYTFDNGGWSSAKYRSSTGTAPVLYTNETYLQSFHIEPDYSVLGIRFSNTASYSTEYCWLDHISIYTYVFGDYLISFDGFGTSPYIGWSFENGASVSSYSYCPHASCIYLYYSSGSYYPAAVRQYNNITMYNNLVLSFDVYLSTSDSRCKLYYSYNGEPYILLGYIPSSSGGYGLLEDLTFAIPDASMCGATMLKVKFEAWYRYCLIDNVILWGDTLQTIDTTAFPTHFPTSITTKPTVVPTSDPTVHPTSNPSNVPSLDPTNIPTLPTTHMPSVSPVTHQPSNNPSLHPTSTPSSNPLASPSNHPTDSPSLFPTLPSSLGPSKNPSLAPTHIPSTTPSYIPSATPTNPSVHPSLIPSSTPITALTGHPSLRPTDSPSDIPSSAPSHTSSQRPTLVAETTLTTQGFDFCGEFDMNITTTLNTPSTIYKDLNKFTLVINSTKRAIYTEITLSRRYNVFQFTQDVWNSFRVYALRYIDIVDGVSFIMEYCSSWMEISNIISAKMEPYLREEIEYHIQMLIQDAISSPVVVIQAVEGMEMATSDVPILSVSLTTGDDSQSSEEQNAKTQDTDGAVGVLAGFLVAITLIIFIVGAVLRVIWYMKTMENANEEKAHVAVNEHQVRDRIEKEPNQNENKPIQNANVELQEAKEDIEIVECVNRMDHAQVNDVEGGQTRLGQNELTWIDDIMNSKDVVNEHDDSVSVGKSNEMIMAEDNDIIAEINKLSPYE